MPYYTRKEAQMEEKTDKEKQEKMKKHLQNFNSVFNTNVERLEEQIPVLILLFDEFVAEIYAPSIDGNKFRDEKIKLMNKFEEIATNEQKKLLEKITEYDNMDFEHLVEQAFCFGFALSSQLNYESNLIIQKKNELKS